MTSLAPPGTVAGRGLRRFRSSVISYQLSVMSYERFARFSAPHQLTELMEGVRGGQGEF